MKHTKAMSQIVKMKLPFRNNDAKVTEQPRTTKALAPVLLLVFILIGFWQLQTAVAQKLPGKSLNRENKLLKKHFGFEIPKTAKITNQLVTRKAKSHTYLSRFP